MGVLEVKVESKWKASSETTVGLKGGSCFFAFSFSQSMVEKKQCPKRSSIPSGPAQKTNGLVVVTYEKPKKEKAHKLYSK